MDVVIVEDHHHCLEHIHFLIRKKKIFERWSMLHFDAHPDLACPTVVPAVACFTPRYTDEDGVAQTLYDIMDSSASSIAEWILPLVLAAQLETVIWVKPQFSNQLPLGEHKFHVGAFDPKRNKAPHVQSFWDLSPTASLKVDWNHSYYWDDNSVVETEQLDLPQPLKLQVLELSHPITNEAKEAEPLLDSKEPWILDICLDYFACFNPYLTDIDVVDPAITQALLQLLSHADCFVDPAKNQTLDSKYLENVHQYQRELTALLSGIHHGVVSLPDTFTCFYSSTDLAKALYQDLERLLRENERAIKPVMEAIPFWNMPHEVVSSSTIRRTTIFESIRRLEQTLMKVLPRDSNNPPFLVTIARSAKDGFTPSHIVEELQEKILEMLHRVYCGKNCESNCALRVTKDYGEWEGSTLQDFY